ncbi:MAG: ferritin family protein [Planctomycetota bacterium]|jgi:rubrerythrin
MSLRSAAVAIEKRMARFYRELARTAGDAESREIFTFMASQEEQHAAQLMELEWIDTAFEDLAAAFEASSEGLKCALSGREDVEVMVQDLEGQREILDLALECEEGSIAFYRALLGHVEEEDLKLQVHQMIEFEIDHKKQITTMLKILDLAPE